MLVVEEGFVSLDFGCISDEIVVDVFGGLGHVYFLFVVIAGKEVGQCSAVIEMGVCDDDHGYFFGVDAVEEGETVCVFFVDHESAVEHDFFVVDGEYEAAASDFASCS